VDNTEKCYQLVTVSFVLADTETTAEELIEAVKESPLTRSAYVVGQEIREGPMLMTEAECEHILKFFR